ncbi:hypothetical protein AB0D14_11520 [Streptomyces sp. NPDC048484]|uniref:hypothetical protein n=1 Tax=Streptomyces sp. NPDC048484 TaxID=3155146 RepID=UPI00343B0009
MTRRAMGRRALRLMLLLGGLFVLGLLSAEQARAADGVVSASKPTGVVRSVTGSVERMTATTPSAPSMTSTTSLLSAASSASASASGPGSGSGAASAPASAAVSEQPGLPEAVVPATDEVQRVVRPVIEQVVRPVTERVVAPAVGHVVRPIGDLVDQITDGVAEQPAPPQWWPSLPLPQPQSPTLPAVPGLPEPPGLSPPALSGQTLPAGTAAQEQQQGGAAGKDQDRAAEKHARGESVAAEFGPRFAGGRAAVADDDVRHHAHARGAAQVTRAAKAPVHQVPGGDPTGALRCHSAVDSGSPRHGDAQAVTFNGRVRPTLVPGAAADVTAAGIRDRHRNIPASPG